MTKINVICFMALGLILAICGHQTYLLRQEVKSLEQVRLAETVKSLEDKLDKTAEEFSDHVDDIYILMKSDSSKLYTIMDTEVRILHYTKPHKHPVWLCPECAEQKDREKLDAQKEIQGQSGHKHGSEGVEKSGPQ
jgi:hypothetical protein